jgi:hypothetical protein
MLRNLVFLGLFALPFSAQADGDCASLPTGEAWYWRLAPGESNDPTLVSQNARLRLAADGSATLVVGSTRDNIDSGHGSGPIVTSHDFVGQWSRQGCTIRVDFRGGNRYLEATLAQDTLAVTESDFMEGIVFQRR